MLARLVAVSLMLAPLAPGASAVAQDWPQWRGPHCDNRATAGATAPIEWSEDAGLAWSTPLPGRGHSSPTLVGERIYLTTADADAQTQSLLIVDRRTGALVRTVVVHEGGLPARIHPNNSHASPTVASDGQHVYALFCNQNAAMVTAFDLDGEQLWQQRAGAFDPQRFQFGFGSSPVIVGDVIVMATEYDGPESGLYALDLATGAQRWHAPRPNSLSYSTPRPLSDRGRSLLLLSGNNLLAAYNAADGQVAWSVPGSTMATCGTMVADAQSGLAFASGGFPGSFTVALRLDGAHDVVWQNNVRCYEQSLLLAGDFLYATADNGVAYCWRAADGEEMWKRRLGGKYSSSPLLVGDRIYATNERGTTFVLAATPEECRVLAENRLGDSAFATPAPADGRLYHRYGKTVDGRRQEYLVAIGE
ncbi:MAG: PQQ-binding-like beta-propeller repeat protein [Planctomycetales bacterium]|nr:PQQ-binding-like beta-propeller repeat protein [Planctomycetales bacterium]